MQQLKGAICILQLHIQLVALQMTPNSSIHILAKSAENTPANSQTGGHDWVDLKETPEDQADAVTKDGKSAAQADKVQHEVAALKMAQGLLKGVLSLRYFVAFQRIYTISTQGSINSQSTAMQHQVSSGQSKGLLVGLFGYLAHTYRNWLKL